MSVLDIPFLGAVVPREISSLSPLMKEVNDGDFARVLRFTLFYLAGHATEEEEEQRWNNELKNLSLGLCYYYFYFCFCFVYCFCFSFWFCFWGLC